MEDCQSNDELAAAAAAAHFNDARNAVSPFHACLLATSSLQSRFPASDAGYF